MANLPKLDKDRAGQTDTNPAGPAAALAVIRHIAASQAIASDGNKESVKNAPPAASNDARVGDVHAPAKAPADRNTARPEKRPPFAGEPLSGDGWGRAADAARKQLRGK